MCRAEVSYFCPPAQHATVCKTSLIRTSCLGSSSCSAGTISGLNSRQRMILLDKLPQLLLTAALQTDRAGCIIFAYSVEGAHYLPKVTWSIGKGFRSLLACFSSTQLAKVEKPHVDRVLTQEEGDRLQICDTLKNTRNVVGLQQRKILNQDIYMVLSSHFCTVWWKITKGIDSYIFCLPVSSSPFLHWRRGRIEPRAFAVSYIPSAFYF